MLIKVMPEGPRWRNDGDAAVMDPPAGGASGAGNGPTQPPVQPAATPAPAAPDIAAGTPAAPSMAGSGATPPVPAMTPAERTGRVFHAVLRGLGGSTEPVEGPNGTIIDKPVPATPGSFAKRILAGALAGLSGAAEAPEHPGAGVLTGLGAGAGAAIKQNQQQDAVARAKVQQNIAGKQKATQDLDEHQARQLQNGYYTIQNATAAFDLTRKQVTASEDASRAYNEAQKTVAADPNKIEMTGPGPYGTFPNFPAVTKYAQDNKEIHDQITGAHSSGQVFTVPFVGEDGKYAGVKAYVVHTNYDDQTLAQAFPDGNYPKILDWKEGAVDAKGVQAPGRVIETTPSPNTKVGAFRVLQQDRMKQFASLDSQKAIGQAAELQARAAMETAKGAAATTTAATKSAGDLSDAAVQQDTAKSLVEGRMAPSELSKRATKGSNNYNSILSAANAYSMQTTGKPYNPAQADVDFKFAQNPATQNTLKYLNSLTGADNKSGNLQQLVQQSNGITRTDFPALNNAAAWSRLSAGDPAMAAYHATVTEVADQVAKILQGGQGGTSDAKMAQASELFKAGFSKNQITSVAGTLRDLLANRKSELIQSNPFLKAQFSPAAAAPAAAAKPAASAPAMLPGESPVIQNGKVIGYTKPGVQGMRAVTGQ